MDEDDIPKTAFRAASGGLFEFTRMPYCLCNAPATYQRLIESMLDDFNYQNLLIYLEVFVNQVESNTTATMLSTTPRTEMVKLQE